MVSHAKGKHRFRLFQNRILRRIFGPKGEEVVGGYRRLHNEGLPNLYASSDFIGVMKLRRKRWVGHVACVGKMRFWLENLKGRGHLEDLDINGKTLEWNLGKRVGGCEMELFGSGWGPLAGSDERSNEP
jgi:hypothetical protein